MANQYTFEIPGSFKPTNPYPTDYYYGPWTSTTQALLATTGTRYSGQTVCVVTGGVAQLYWFKTGIADGDLVLKDSGAVGNFLSISGGTVTGNTNFSGNLSASTIYYGPTDLKNLFLPATNLGGGAYQFSGGNNSVKFGYFDSFSTITDSTNFLTSLSVNDSGNGIIFQSKGKLTGSTDNKFSILPDFVRFQTTGNFGAQVHTDLLDADYDFQFPAQGGTFAMVSDLTGLTINAANGLTKTGNTIELGGALNKNTSLTGEFNLGIGEINNEISNFKVYSKLSLNHKYGGLNDDGSGFDSFVFQTIIQPDEKVLASGFFTTYNGVNAVGIIRLNIDGSIDGLFNSGGTGFDQTSRTIELQSDGKIIVGGSFSTYNGNPCSAGIVRLNSDGSIDATFNNGGDGFDPSDVEKILLQPDGKILVSGNFTTYNAQSVNNFIRLNSDGTLDAAFNSGGTGVNGSVYSLDLQSDGKIIVVGNFSTYNGTSCPTSFIRLNSDGTLDATFNNGGAGFDGIAGFAKVLSTGKILVGGGFDNYNGSACPARLVRINTDGTLDATFNNGGAGFDNSGYVITISIQSDDKILVGGDFSSYNGVTTNNLVRINSDGTLDSGFNSGGSGFSDPIRAISIQSDDKILAGGQFSTYNGTTVPYGITRLNSDGSLNISIYRSVLLDGLGALRYADNYHDEYTDRTLVDKAYVNNMISSSTVSISTLAGSGLSKILSGSSSVIELGGTLNHDTILTGDTYNFDLYSKLSLNNKYKGFNEDGSGFSVGSIYSTTVLSDGKILASGVFSGYNGSDCSDNLIGLNSDGSVDSTFNSGGTGFNGYVLSTTLQSDGKIIVGGDFTTYNGVDCSDKLVRLNTNGTVDSTFNSGGTGFNSFVNSTTILSDGKILVIGVFASYNGDFDCPNGLARLNSNGTLDSTFNTGGFGFDNQVRSAAIQSDGKIIVGGLFTTYNGANCPDKLARINSDGTIDSTFNIGGTGFTSISDILSVTLQSDGKIIVGGDFTTYNGVSCSDYLVRIDTDGYVDSTFNSGGTGFNNYVRSAVVQSDGKIIVGGLFTTYNGIDCQDRLVRLNSDGTIDSTFNVGGSGFDGEVLSITVQSNGKILVGGNFASYNGSACPDKLVRLNSDGTLDINKNTKVLLNGDGALRYEANYHDEYTDRSLVDKEYVDSSIANNNLSGINGINIANGLASLNGNFIHASNNGDSEITLTDTSFNVKIANNYSLYDRTAYDNSGNTVFNWDKGFIERHFTTQSVDYTVQPTDYVIIINGSGPITITLPSASDHYGRELIFKHSARGSDVTTIDGAGSTIDGQPTHLMTSAYTSVRLFSDNTDWFVVGN